MSQPPLMLHERVYHHPVWNIWDQPVARVVLGTVMLALVYVPLIVLESTHHTDNIEFSFVSVSEAAVWTIAALRHIARGIVALRRAHTRSRPVEQ